MEKVFVDTSAWIALYDTRDKYHADAKHILETLKNQRKLLVTTDYIFDEIITSSSRAFGYPDAVKIGEGMLGSAVLRIVDLERETKDRAWEIFKKHGAMKLSFTDCTSFAFMARHGLSSAFTFDQDFKKMGFEIVG